MGLRRFCCLPCFEDVWFLRRTLRIGSTQGDINSRRVKWGKERIVLLIVPHVRCSSHVPASDARDYCSSSSGSWSFACSFLCSIMTLEE